MEENKKLSTLLFAMKDNAEETELPMFNGGRFTHRHIQPLMVGKYYLSVQASIHHYCHPKDNVALENYESFEIALMDDEGSFHVIQDVFPGFELSDELHEYYEDPIYPHVPIELVAELYDHAKKVTE